jgi:predicted permease
MRNGRWQTIIEATSRDLTHAVRNLLNAPGFTAVATLTLALSIGATTAIFGLLDAVILKSLPVRNPEELVLVGGSQYPVFQAFRRHTNMFADLCATSGITPLNVEIQDGMAERTGVSLVSGSYFSTLGVQAALGAVFTSEHDRLPGEHPVAVLSHGFWLRRFGRDPAILNRTVRITGVPITIIGVAPPGFFGEQVGAAPDLWLPLTMWGHVVPGRNLLENPGAGWLQLLGRLHAGLPTSGVQPELTATFRQVIGEVFGPTMPDDVRRDTNRAVIRLEPVGKGLSSVRTQFARPLQLMMGAVGVVLLIACANIASLLLVRATARRREFDIRLALGMSRSRLMRQLLVESVVLAMLGGAAGIAFSWVGTEALLRLISADGSRVPVPVAIDARLMVFAALTVSATAVGFGFAPAWQAARTSPMTAMALRREVGAPPRQRLNSLLVIVQVALSLVLLMGAGLFLRTIANLRNVNLGFTTEQLLVLDVNPNAAGYSGERAVALTRALLEQIEAVPGVSSVSVSEHGVLMGTANGTNLMRPEGFAAGPEGFPQARWDVVGPRYFSTIGTRLVSGRDFSERDDRLSPFVVAINEDMARYFFAGADPIGRRMIWDVGGSRKTFDIVAVTRDVKERGARDEPRLRFYLPYFQLPQVRPTWILASTRFVVRTVDNPTPLAPVMRELIRSEDPKLAITTIVTGPELVSRTLVRERMVATLLIAFGALAVGLACLGLYGLVAYQAARRTSEIGVRMALGAQRRQVMWVTMRRGLLWMTAGVTIGIPVALSTSRVAEGLLFGLAAKDLASLLGAAGVLVAVGLLAAGIPAYRASRIDPLTALRSE